MAFLKTAIGGKVLSYLEKKALESQAPPNRSQSGQAGAVPQPDTAPLTGSAHEDSSTVIKPEGGTVSNDNGFHWHNNQTMADVANEELSEDGHSTNGTSYDNHKR